ncbi:MAG: hypothetical protein JWP15_2322 [Alphaproteobacteria bacterium]|nr:hypothetical protein [Alphaproteobacteria bacterium]
MRAIFVAMLCVQVGLALVTAYTIVMAKPSPNRPRPVWSSLAFSLLVTSMVSSQIADRHDLSSGAQLLHFGSAVLLGMGLVSLLVLLRQRLGRDRVETLQP